MNKIQKRTNRVTSLAIVLALVCLWAGAVQAQAITVWMTCTGVAATDTAELAAIKVAYGTTKAFTIKLPNAPDVSKRCAFNTEMLTSNLTLDNTDGSGLAVVTGQVLTVGSIVNPPGKQIFFNALSGQGTVAVSTGVVSAAWWGTTTAAIQAAATAATGRALYFSSNAVISYDLTDTITIPAGTTVYGDGFGSLVKQTVVEKNAFNLGDNCSVKGLNIEGPGSGTNIDLTKGNGIYVSGAKNVRVSNNFIHGFNAAGIQARDSFNLSINANILYQNTGLSSESDILFYSSSAGGRATISNNLCFSNNSQGISVNLNGGDSDISIVGNICVTLNSSWAEMTAGSLVRRHGILASYNGVDGSGRITIVANAIRNTLWTGINRATAVGLPVATVISSNVISMVGLEANQTLSGGIMLNGVGRNDLIEGNSVYDYRGTLASSVGAITYNQAASPAGQFATIRGNSISLSTGHGIAIKGAAVNMTIEDNRIEGVTGSDINLEPDAGISTLGGHVITNNRINHNINTTAAAININTQDGTVKIIVNDNVINGFDATTYAVSNSGIRINAPSCAVTVKRNTVTNTYHGVYIVQAITGRQFDFHRIDYNEFESLNTGIVAAGGTSAPVIPFEGNVFKSTTTKTSGDGGFVVGYIATREGDTIRVHDLFTAAPTIGTWAVGDYATNKTPAVGQPKGWVCTVAGNPGTWVSVGNL